MKLESIYTSRKIYWISWPISWRKAEGSGLENGAKAWNSCSNQYVEAEVNNVVDYLEKRIHKLVAKAPTSLLSGYHPEVDVTGEFDAADASYYHSLIDIIRCIVELGRIDITCEVLMISSHLELPCKGNLKEVLHVFVYFKNKMNSELVFDPTIPEIGMDSFQTCPTQLQA